MELKLDGILPIVVNTLKVLPIPENALERLKQINQLLQYALPVAKMVASVTPTQADDKVVEVVHMLALTLSDLLKNSTVTHFANANRQAVSVELLRNSLIERVEAGDKIEFGKRVLASKEDVLAIPQSILDACVTSANAINKSQV